MSELELAALAAAAVPGMQIRQIRGDLVNVESGQWLRLVDAQGEQWLAWAPASSISGDTMVRYVQTLDVLVEATSLGLLPWMAPQIVGSVFREGGGEVFVSEYPGGGALTTSDLNSGGLLPASVGSALAALHELPVESYKAACRRYADESLTRQALRSLIKRHADAIPSRLRSRWLDALDEDSLWGFDPVPLHGCLSAANVFAYDGAVVGMTRFDQAAVGDPAADLVWLMYYASDDFLNVFEESYAMNRTVADLHLLTRAQLLSEIETLRWYARGFAADDRSWREQGLSALKALDSDIGDQRLVPHRPEVVEITFGVEDEPLLRLQGSGSHPSVAAPSEGASSPHSASVYSSGGVATTSRAESATDVLSLPSDMTGPYDPFASEASAEDLEPAHDDAGPHFDPAGEVPQAGSPAVDRQSDPEVDAPQEPRVTRPRRVNATGSIEVP